jgi:hypothetical protein
VDDGSGSVYEPYEYPLTTGETVYGSIGLAVAAGLAAYLLLKK